MHEEARDGVPTCLSVAPCSEPSRPSPAGGREERPALTAPARDAPNNRRPGRRNGLMARTKELHGTGESDDIVFPPRSARGQDEMEDRSSRRMRTLVTQMVHRDLSAKKNACALISMMARSSNRSNQRPDTLMQDRNADRSTKPSCDARPDHTFGSFASIGSVSAISGCPLTADMWMSAGLCR